MFSISVKLKDAACKYGVKFIDSYAFLNSSLDSLASNLKQSGHDMPFLKSHLTSLGYSDRVLALATRKGHFCYEAITSDSVLDRTEIPSKEEFYSQLRGSGISDSDYSEVIEMWEAAKCTSLRDYMKIYLLIVTLLPTEVFQTFRGTMTRE